MELEVRPFGPQENPYIDMSPEARNSEMETIFSLIPQNIGPFSMMVDQQGMDRRANSPLFATLSDRLANLIATSGLVPAGQQFVFEKFQEAFIIGNSLTSNFDSPNSIWSSEYRWGSESGGIFGSEAHHIDEELYSQQIQEFSQAYYFNQKVGHSLTENEERYNKMLKEALGPNSKKGQHLAKWHAELAKVNSDK